MTDRESLIEFPCRFPIKAMGRDQSEFEAHVLQIISAHVNDIIADDVMEAIQVAHPGRGTRGRSSLRRKVLNVLALPGLAGGGCSG